MHWAYYLTFALLISYFLLLFVLHLRRRKRGDLRSSCDCSGKGRMLVASYHALKRKEARKGNEHPPKKG